MRKKSPIKIKLVHEPCAPLSSGVSRYRISQISGAITVDADKRLNITVGSSLTIQEAEQLNRYHQVTVMA